MQMPWREDEHSHPSRGEVMNEWNDTSIPANIINKFCLIKRRYKLQYIPTKIITTDTFPTVYIRYENRPLGRPRRRWEDNIKMDLQEVGCGGMDWIELAQDRDRWWTLVNVVRNLRVL